jgi:hypothetical protein
LDAKNQNEPVLRDIALQPVGNLTHHGTDRQEPASDDARFSRG